MDTNVNVSSVASVQPPPGGWGGGGTQVRNGYPLPNTPISRKTLLPKHRAKKGGGQYLALNKGSYL